MKRVLLLSGELSLRGSTLYTINLARELKHRGHRVAVLAPGGLFEQAMHDQRSPLLRAPVHRSFARNLLYLNRWVSLARDHNAQVIHVQNQDLAVIGALLGQQLDCPVVATAHAQAPERIRFRWSSPPHFVAVSEHVRQSLVTTAQLPRDQIEVIPNGVSASLSALEDDEHRGRPVVGTVNRIADDRGIDDLLCAAREVLDRGVDASFLIIGEGPGEHDVRRMARKLDLTKHVTFVLVRSRIAALFRPMDLFVSASRTEGHGIFLLSAMAQARPVISTAVGGAVGFLRDEENAMVVPRGDVEGLAERIQRLLGDRTTARRLAHEGFRQVRAEFPLHTMVERTVSTYERAHDSSRAAN